MYHRLVEISSSTDALSRFGHALSDPTRTRVLLRLREGPAYPADLADLAAVSRQTMSNHLARLRGSGLIVGTTEGRRTRYELTDTRIGHALADLLDASRKLAKFVRSWFSSERTIPSERCDRARG